MIDRRLALLMVLVLVIVGSAAYLLGNRIGYDKGYRVAYTSEHSHFSFEKRRADNFQKRILGQRRCINRMAAAITPVDGSGFEAFGQTFQKFGLIYWGTVRCNRDADFAFVSRQQYQRIIPSSK